MIDAPVPGDVWAVSTGDSFAAKAIRLGAVLIGRPGVVNHVVGVHHQDRRGRWWGIEGRPGGVGWVDLKVYQGKPLALLGNTNAKQERDPAQRKAICAASYALIGDAYDWVGGIAADGLAALKLKGLATWLDEVWGWQQGDKVPGHVVCSTLYAWVYQHLGLASPTGEQVTPADWWTFNNAL